jgi:hypothetical protein
MCSLGEYKQKVAINSEEIMVGRVTLSKTSKEIFDRAEKRVKLDDSLGKKSSVPIFFFTESLRAFWKELLWLLSRMSQFCWWEKREWVRLAAFNF